MAFQYPGFQLNAFQITRRGNLNGQCPSPTGHFTAEEEAVTGDLDGTCSLPTGEFAGVVCVAGDLDGTCPKPVGDFEQEAPEVPAVPAVGRARRRERLYVYRKPRLIEGHLRGKIEPPVAHFVGQVLPIPTVAIPAVSGAMDAAAPMPTAKVNARSVARGALDSAPRIIPFAKINGTVGRTAEFRGNVISPTFDSRGKHEHFSDEQLEELLVVLMEAA